MSTQTYSPTSSVEALRGEIVGLGKQVPLLDGSMRQYVYLDNAASTPALKSVVAKLEEALEWYSSVHRGTGFKSMISTYAYEKAREIVMEFVGGTPGHDVVIFGKNTSEMVNILATCTCWEPGDVVLTTMMEHHSNDLPWRGKAQVVYVGVDREGFFDFTDFEEKLKAFAGRVKLVACTGASNVTGFTPPVHKIASLAHRYGALMLVDCAQLAPHRKVDMGQPETPEHIDFVTLSGHKMYAPFGTGAMIGPKEYFNKMAPCYRGGGTIEIVTLKEVYWAEAPDRQEAGSPNVLGAVALAASIRRLEEVGMDAVAEHEKMLTSHALERLNRVPGLRIYGSHDPARVDDRLGVISFSLGDMPHAKLAAILSFEGAIGVRNGCFCAHPYLMKLMGVTDDEYQTFKNEVLHNDRSHRPGLVRASFGCYTNCEEIDHLADRLERAAAGDIAGKYELNQATGSYLPAGYDPALIERYFRL